MRATRFTQVIPEDDDSDFELEDAHPAILYLRERLFPEEHYNILRARIPKFQVLSPRVDYFGALGMCVVLANLITLALYDPFDQSSSTSVVLSQLDIAFLSFFSFEVLLKLVILQPRVMFANNWNTLDVFIVVSSVIAEFIQSFLPQLSSVAGLRAVRVLRPLRAIGKIPEVRVVVNAMLRSLKHIADVGILFLLFLVSFATTGLVQFKGKLRFRCVRNEAFIPGLFASLYGDGTLPPLLAFETRNMSMSAFLSIANWSLSDFVCGSTFDSSVAAMNNFSIACSSEMVCDVSNPDDFFVGMKCPYGYTCSEVENPGYGYMGFDNLGQALLTVQTTTTLEGWSNMLAATVGATSIAAIFFCLGVAVIGSFFVVNVLVAIINSEFSTVHEEERQNDIRNKLLDIRAKKTLLRYGGTIEKLFERFLLEIEARQRRYLTLRRIIAKERHVGGFYHMRQADFEGAVITKFDRFRSHVAYRVVETKGFVYGTAVAMVLMLVSMAVSYDNMPETMVTTLSAMTNFFVAIIAVELLFRFLATDPFVFTWSLSNFVGLVVVGVSIADLSLADFSFPAIRVLRLVIAMKLIRLFPTVYRHLLIVLGSLRASGVLIAVIGLHLFIVATLGMQLFGGQFCGLLTVADGGIDGGPCNSRPRENFDTFGAALITAFELLCTDGWTSIMYNAMRSTNSTAGTVFVAILFVILYAIGVYILLNLFIAILINSTTEISSVRESDREVKSRHAMYIALPEEDLSGRIDMLHDFGESVFGFEEADQAEEMAAKEAIEQHKGASLKKAQDILSGNHHPHLPKNHHHHHLNESGAAPSLPIKVLDDDDDPFALPSTAANEQNNEPHQLVNGAEGVAENDSGSEPEGSDDDENNPHALVRRPVVEEKKKRTWVEFLTTAKASEEVQLSGGRRMQLFRRICRVAVGNRVTQMLLLVLVLLSTVSLMVEDPVLAPDQWLPRALAIFDYVSSSFFLMECLLKIVAHGFINGKNSYLRRTRWNVLDFSLVLLNIAQLVLSNLGNTRGLRSTKVLYAFRPLRLVRRSKGMRLVVKSLIHSIVPIKDVMLIIGAFWILFAIAGVQFFQGSFYSCQTSNTTYNIVTRTDCAIVGGQWNDADFNFDHLGAAMMSLFVISTLQGWENIMYYGMDAVGKDMQPQTDHNPWASLYFVVFAVLGGFFFVSLFVSVIIQSYEAQRQRLQKQNIFLTPEQQSWLESQKKIFSAVPLLALDEDVDDDGGHGGDPAKSPLERLRHIAFKVTASKYFDRLINLVVVTSIALIAVEHYPMSTTTQNGLFYGNLGVTIFYVVEVCLRLFALGPQLYWSSNWFRFDTVVTIGSLLDLILGRVFSLERSYGTILRSLRIVRVVRVIDKNHRLSDLIRKFIAALYGLANVTLLLMLFVTIMAMITMRLFGHLRRDFTYITPTYNFENFGNSVMLLLSMLLGGPWPNVMTSCMAAGQPNCDPNIGDCGSVVGATLLFTAFVVFGNFVLINIFVAVIVDTFQPQGRNDGGTTAETEDGNRSGGWGLTESEVSEFVDAWLKFDSAKTLSVAGGDLMTLLKSLDPQHPFYPPAVSEMYKIVGQYELRQDFCELRFVSKLMLDEVCGRVEFFDVVTALTRVQCNVKLPDDVMNSLRTRFGRRYRIYIERARKLKRTKDGAQLATGDQPAERRGRSPPSIMEIGGGGGQVLAGERQELLDRYAAMFLLRIWRRRRQAVLAQKHHSSSQPMHSTVADLDQTALGGGRLALDSPLLLSSPAPSVPFQLPAPPPIRPLSSRGASMHQLVTRHQQQQQQQLGVSNLSSLFSSPQRASSGRFVDHNDDYFAFVDVQKLDQLDAEMRKDRILPVNSTANNERRGSLYPPSPVTAAAAVSKYVVRVPDHPAAATATSSPTTRRLTPRLQHASISDDDDPFSTVSDDEHAAAAAVRVTSTIPRRASVNISRGSDKQERLRALDDFLDL